MKNKTKTLAAFALLLALLPFVTADRYEKYCLGYGDVLHFEELCPPLGTPYFCDHTFCGICVHILDDGKICTAHPGKCDNSLACFNTGGNATIDSEPPVLQINSPTQGQMFTQRSVFLDLTVNEPSDVKYINSADPRRPIPVCSDCTSYSRGRTFEEGRNDVTFIATDGSGNSMSVNRTFYIDSQDPQIKSLEPESGFVSGAFTITFAESNPDELIIHYGNSETGLRQYNVNLNSECTKDSNYECHSQINLSDYDGQQIEFYAVLTDIAGNTDESAHKTLSVDYSAPLITAFSYTVSGKDVTFFVAVTEPFFSEITYIDNSNNQKEQTLCSKLVNDVCEKKVSFTKDGNHDVTVIVKDMAGNSAIKPAVFFTDSKKPKIQSTEPSDDFASGTFEVEFDEENPASLVLNYGNDLSGFKEKTLDLAQCTNGYCSSDVSLSDYDGEEISYWFVLTDIAGSSVQDGAEGLMVDMSFPVINSLNYQVNGKSVTFTLDITESYLDEITYIDNSESKPKEKTLCTKLTNSICEKKVSFTKDGSHDVTITVKDKAGHTIVQGVEFFTDSKKPKITSVFPADFTFGLFDISFEEKNPTSLVLEYGNNALGFKTVPISLADDCTSDDKEYSCYTNVDLADYDGEEIDYSFILTDIAGQTAQGGENGLIVDTTFPVIDSLTYTLNGKKATITLSVTESNLDKVTYINYNDARPIQKMFCSKLKNGSCTKTIMLNADQNNLSFQIIDKAGNSIGQSLTITV
jgi:C4-type Zn-finger protein